MNLAFHGDELKEFSAKVFTELHILVFHLPVINCRNSFPFLESDDNVPVMMMHIQVCRGKNTKKKKITNLK